MSAIKNILRPCISLVTWYRINTSFLVYFNYLIFMVHIFLNIYQITINWNLLYYFSLACKYRITIHNCIIRIFKSITYICQLHYNLLLFIDIVFAVRLALLVSLIRSLWFLHILSHSMIQLWNVREKIYNFKIMWNINFFGLPHTLNISKV